jgi:hypothetical protein
VGRDSRGSHSTSARSEASRSHWGGVTLLGGRGDLTARSGEQPSSVVASVRMTLIRAVSLFGGDVTLWGGGGDLCAGGAATARRRGNLRKVSGDLRS